MPRRRNEDIPPSAFAIEAPEAAGAAASDTTGSGQYMLTGETDVELKGLRHPYDIPSRAGKKLEFDAQFKGPRGNRKCRDLLMLLLFLIFWGGMIAVAALGIREGDLNRLVRPLDVHGNLCAVDNTNREDVEIRFNYERRNFLAWPVATGRIIDVETSICVSTCPQQGEDISITGLDYSADEHNPTPITLNYTTSYDTKRFIFFCMPAKGVDVAREAINKAVSRGSEVLNRLFGDLSQTSREMAGSVVLAVVLAFFWVIFIRIFARLVIWMTILGTLAFMSSLTGLVLKKASDMQEEGDDLELDAEKDNAKALEIFGYVLLGITVLLFFLILWFRRRIDLAVRVVQEAGHSLTDMPSLVITPYIIGALVFVLAIYWIIIALYIVSAGDIQQIGTTPTRKISLDADLRRAVIFHFFGLLWTVEFFLALGYLVIAGAVAAWYFTMEKKRSILRPYVIQSWYRAVRYHLGSLAFGALLLAILGFTREVLKHIKKKTQQTQGKLAKCLTSALYCCFDCCLKCVERFLRYVNRHAYIQIAIHGKGYCASAAAGFWLVVRNALRIAILHLVGDFLLFLGKLVVVSGASLLCFALVRENNDISSPILPVVVVMFASYAIARGFFAVYDMAIDTVFQCFCEDSERNDGSAERPFFMTKSLREFVSSEAKRRMKQAQKEQRAARM